MITEQFASNTLKNLYLGLIAKKLNESNPLLAKINQTSDSVWGKEIRKSIPIKSKDNAVEYIQFCSVLKNLYGTVDVSERIISAADNVGALVNLIGEDIQDMLHLNQKEISRMLFSDSKSENELTGLHELFDIDKPLYSVSRKYKIMQPLIIKDFGAFDEIRIQNAIDLLADKGANIDLIIVSSDVKYAYMGYIAQYKRNIDVMNLDGGFKSLSFNGVPFVYDRFVPSGTMYLLDTSVFHLHQLCDWRFLETENGNILRQTQGYPTYAATLVKYCDLICDHPNYQGKISGITAKETKQ